MGILRGRDQPLVKGYLALFKEALYSGEIVEAQRILRHLLARTVLGTDPPPVRSAVALAGASVVRTLIELGDNHGLTLGQPLENLVEFFDSIFEGEHATVEIPDLDGSTVVVEHESGEARIVSAPEERIAGARWKVCIIDNGLDDAINQHAIEASASEIGEWMLDGYAPFAQGKLSWADASRVWRSCFDRIWRRAFVEPCVPTQVRRGTGAAGLTLVLSLQSLSRAEPVLERWQHALGALADGCRMEVVLAQDDGVLLDLEYDRGVRRVRASEINEHSADLSSTIENVEVRDEAPGAPPSTPVDLGVFREFRDFGSAAAQQRPVRRETTKIGRNEPCPCGSGKKYKKCCG